jgi:hypothetical protein
MHSKLRPSPAMIVALIALFVALGGSAAALSGSNTVFTDDIANDTQAASGGNPAGGLVAADLRPSSVGTSEVANNSLTGTDINEATLSLGAGAWHEIGAGGGEPDFGSTADCGWRNFDNNHNSAAFVRDRFGFVHLKGLVHAFDTLQGFCVFSQVADTRIFTLPPGYRPARRNVFATITNNTLGRTNVDGPQTFVAPGAVSVSAPTTAANAKAFLSLDGISFRCAPSGSNGCP